MKIFIRGALLSLIIVCFLQEANSKSFSNARRQAFVISATNGNNALKERFRRSVEDDSKKGTTIKNMHVTSVVMSRFARVTVESVVENTLNDSQEIIFSIRLPEAAFITEFQMKVSGVTFLGKVKEKEVAKKQFQAAVESGNSAGLVTADVRETQTFNIASYVAAQSSVTFTLVYQELLKRKLGEYNHAILVNPKQLVDDLLVEVYITEKTVLTSVSVDLPNSSDAGRRKSKDYGEVPINYNIRRSKHQAKITFKPTKDQQQRLLMIPEDERKMTVRYDVTREVLGGEIQRRNGYFVHFFAPEDLPILPKNVVFVIDRSGSMSGRKMEQTKKAFSSVLKEMRNTDMFNIISFAGDVSVWNKESLVDVDKDTVEDAVNYVTGIVATGATNINGAMLRAAELLDDVESDGTTSSMIILLTDGDPTSGVTNTDQIRLNVKRAVAGKYSVFCLGFGRNLNHDFIKKLANENDGLARQIYEDSDADLQLEGFFQEVASPLLLHVQITYKGSTVTNVTKSSFDKYFKGSEVVIVGAIQDKEERLRTVVRAEGGDGRTVYRARSSLIEDSFKHWFQDTGDFDNFIERLWAYFTIKELLQKKAVSDSNIERQRIDSRITELALKYSFVTALTSMVVTLPEDEITTTTVSPEISTIHPPIPPCFARDQAIPKYLIGPPIWCPYVMSEDEVNARQSEPPPLTSTVPLTQASAWKYHLQSFVLPSYMMAPPQAFAMMPMPMRRRPRTTSRPRPTYLLLTRRPATTIASWAARLPAFTRTTTTRSTTTTTAARTSSTTTTTVATTTASTTTAPTTKPTSRPDRCNKILTETSGNVASFAVEENSICEWTIMLDESSWIDLHVGSFVSRFNELTILSSNGDTVFKHGRGDYEDKYFLIKSNEVRVRMKLFANGENETFAVKYKSFIPGGGQSSESHIDIFDKEGSNFGGIIYSSNSTSGFISSPDYPESYPSNTRAVWNIINQDPDKFQLQITFIDMDIEMSMDGKCLNDKVVVKYGVKESELCGFDVTGASWKVDENIFQIAFISDDKLETSGFKIEYKFIA